MQYKFFKKWHFSLLTDHLVHDLYALIIDFFYLNLIQFIQIQAKFLRLIKEKCYLPSSN